MLAAAVQVLIYLWMLRPALESHDPLRMRPAFMRWIAIDLAWQTAVLFGAYAYLALAAAARPRPAGMAWIAPGIAAILGTALPLQLVIMAALRAARRQG